MGSRNDAARTGGRRAQATIFGALLVLLFALGLPAGLARAEGDETDLTELDIETLFDLEVTSLSKKAQRLTEAPAAIYVLSGDDIRRSGLRSIPEALRMVPGLQVSRLSGDRWAISARGFNSLFSDKLLVMIDGRSVYTPLFAGVYWDTVDTLIEDIDRIEVIRGPGGTLWGANAVNGVINIVTKNAGDTQGALVSGGYGNIDRFASGRWGGKVGEDVAYRGYAKYYNNDDFDGSPEARAHDKTDQGRGGFRVDWTPPSGDHLTVQGDLYRGDSDGTVDSDFGLIPVVGLVETDTEVRGANILGRYSHPFGDGQEATVQLYYDRTERDDAMWEEWRNTFDLDAQHRFPAWVGSEFVWGLGYRYTDDDVDPGVAGFSPDNRDENLYSTFLQLEQRFFEEQLRLTGGTKAEHNDHTGFEFQPTARAAYVPNDWNTLWFSFTRAVRTPSRSNDDLRIDQVGPIPVPNGVEGNPQSDSEKILAYEAGYRVQPFERVSFDVAAYYNDLDDITTLEVTSLAPVDIDFDNKMHGWGWGVETYAAWRPLDWLNLQAWYSFTHLHLKLDDDSLAVPLIPLGSKAVEKAAPRHTVQLRSSLDLPFDTQFEAAFWFVDEIKALGISPYERVDLRLAWRPIEQLELSVAAQNVTDAHHHEWGTEFGYLGTRIPRTVYGAVTWEY